MRLPSTCPLREVVAALKKYVFQKVVPANVTCTGRVSIRAALNRKAQHRLGEKDLDELIDAGVDVLWASRNLKGSRSDNIVKNVSALFDRQ